MARRKSGATFEQIANKDWALLSKNEHNELQTAFKKTEQRNGGISFYDLINIANFFLCEPSKIQHLINLKLLLKFVIYNI